MSQNPNMAAEIEPMKKLGAFDKISRSYNKFKKVIKENKFWAFISSVIVFSIVPFSNILYDITKVYFLPEDEYLTTIRAEQTKQYEDLKSGLSALKGSIDSSESRSAFKSVSESSDEMFKSYKNLVSQLELSKQENDKLSKLAQKTSGISGGYDFILNEGSSMRIDSSTVIGVENIFSNKHAQVNITAASLENKRNNLTLNAGESIAYKNEQGKSCKVTALTISKDSVSFGNNCG